MLYLPRYSGYGREAISIHKLTVVSTPKTLVRLVDEGPADREYRAMRSRNEGVNDWPILVGTADEYGIREAYPGDHPEIEKARDALKRRNCRTKAVTCLDAAQRAMRQHEPQEALEHCRQAVEWLEKS